MTIYEDFCRSESSRRRINPDTAVTVANSEGSLTEPARRGTFDTGSSWWAFQLHYGGASYEYLGTVAGMGNDFTRVTGWAPGDPAAWRDAMRFALDHVRTYGWGAWYGAKARGITGFDGIDQSVPWSGTPDDEWDYRKQAPGGTVPEQPSAAPAPVYDPTASVVPQNHDWDCAEQSTFWALTAFGRQPSDAWIEQSMIAGGIESTDLGLLVADGSKLAAWITEQYGEFGYGAYNNGHVSFDDVVSVAGSSPVLIGGRQWNHWSGVRRYSQANDWLELANPADGWMGVHQTMTRQQFDALGPFSMVVLTWGGTVAPSVQPDEPPLGEAISVATLMAQVDALTKQRDGLLSAVAYQSDNIGDALTALVSELRRVRQEQVGPRP